MSTNFIGNKFIERFVETNYFPKPIDVRIELEERC